jgi:segregation and condensation protein B
MKHIEIKRLIEAILFLSKDPIKPDKMYNHLINNKVDFKKFKEILDELVVEYKELNRGFFIREVAGGFQFVSSPEFDSELKEFFQKESKKVLSRPSLEVLAIIAYKQPITKAEIDDIRGVDSSSSINTLLDKRLIRIVGRLETLGRPLIYRTTNNFLKVFGLKGINELPEIEGQEVLFEDYEDDYDENED